jgi:hypothetical protein
MNNLVGKPEFAAIQSQLHAKVLHHVEFTGDSFHSYTPTDAAGKPYCTDSPDPRN